MFWFLRWIGRIFLLLISGLLIILAIPYLFCPIYEFPEPKLFSGESWYNPYQDSPGAWLKANFQVQSYTWLGLTAGQDKTADVVAVYKNMDYDIVTVSDYQYINRFKGMDFDYLPVYEHGYNAGKKHQVVIGATDVEWLDYFFWQNRHHKQHILQLLKRNDPFVALAHAGLMSAYSKTDLARLTDYDAIEVLNHFGNCVNLWDVALSAGKQAWIIGNDDSHKISDPGQTGVCWTMIDGTSTQNNDVIDALKSGRMYGVTGKNGKNDILLERVAVENNRLSVSCTGTVNKIRFIGQGGIELKAATDTTAAQIDLKPDYHYVRTEISGPNNTLYLNPVIRTNGILEKAKSATIDFTGTWIQRTAFIFIFLLFTLTAIRERMRQIRRRSALIALEEQ